MPGYRHAGKIPTGTFLEFDSPAINNRDEVAFVATVRRGRETLQALYLYSNGNVWSGRALQEVSSTWQMRSCINVSGL
jgi:hypothetical protein